MNPDTREHGASAMLTGQTLGEALGTNEKGLDIIARPLQATQFTSPKGREIYSISPFPPFVGKIRASFLREGEGKAYRYILVSQSPLVTNHYIAKIAAIHEGRLTFLWWEGQWCDSGILLSGNDLWAKVEELTKGVRL